MPTIRLFPDVKTPGERNTGPLVKPQKLKRALQHADHHVREAAARYFSESYSRDPELLGLVLDACMRHGLRENQLVLDSAASFEISKEDFRRAFEQLGLAKDYNTCAKYGRILANAPAEWLLEYESNLEESGKLTEGVVNKINWRFTFMDHSPEEAWQDLQEYSEECRDSRHVGEVDHHRADSLLDILARADIPPDEQILDLLQDEAVEEEWLEVWLVKLAGLRGILEAVPLLVDYLQVDTGYFRERVVDALARIGDTEAVHLIDRRFATDPQHVKTYASTVPARIKSRVSEKFLLKHLKSEEDVTIRTFLFEGLCRLFSRAGVPVVREEIERGYVRGILSLEHALLNVAEVLGIELPEAEKWRRDREEKEQRRRERREELNRLAGMVRDRKESEGTGRQPARRPKKEVGRNDPCPCGSGRKYKRCCGDPRGKG